MSGNKLVKLQHLLDLFELYDDARTCKHQIYLFLFILINHLQANLIRLTPIIRHRTDSITTVKTSVLRLFQEITDIQCEKLIRYINVLCGHNIQFCNAAAGGNYSHHCNLSYFKEQATLQLFHIKPLTVFQIIMCLITEDKEAM